MSRLYRSLPPLGTLVVFESVFRMGSFTKAADECALSQASVSRQIRQLEENLGIRLFDRHRYDVTATEDGEVFYLSVRRALEELRISAMSLRERASGHHRFTIYSDLSLAMEVLAPMISRLQRQYPDVQFNLLSSYEPIEQTQSSFDIGFQVGRRGENLFDIETIATDEVFPVCSPEFAAANSGIVSAAELSTLSLLQLDYEDKKSMGWRQFLAHYQVKDFKPVDKLVFSSYQVCLGVAEQGEGVALGWGRSVQSKIDDGKLVKFTDLTIPIQDGISVHQKKHVEPHPLAASIINEVKHYVGVM